jgi:hypothetical protein
MTAGTNNGRDKMRGFFAAFGNDNDNSNSNDKYRSRFFASLRMTNKKGAVTNKKRGDDR